MSDEHKNEPRIPIQKSMSTNETRSMPISSLEENPKDYFNLYSTLKKENEENNPSN